MKRAADPLLTASKERARLELRRVLRGLVNLFGYADVKKELFQVKRSVENDRDFSVAGEEERTPCHRRSGQNPTLARRLARR